jgi:hypothetical protein
MDISNLMVRHFHAEMPEEASVDSEIIRSLAHSVSQTEEIFNFHQKSGEI